MTFEEAFRKILLTYADIERVANSDYLYEIDGVDGIFTEEQVIEFAENLN